MTSPDQPTRRPVLAYGATPGRLGILSRSIETADQAELLALDLDLRTSWAIPRVSAMSHASQQRSIRLRSVWLPGDISGLVSERRLQSLEALLVAARERFGLRSLVVPRHQGQSDRGAAIHKLARHIASSKTGSQIRLVIGLQASDFRHDRWHLDQLAGIRRMAEEWDLDLALDLTGNVSLAWEAEAAILRVFPRLTLVRLGQWRREDGTLVPNLTGQIAGRTISMLVDQCYSGVVSLVADRRSPGAALLHEKQDVLQRFVRDSSGVSPKIDAPVSDFTRHDR